MSDRRGLGKEWLRLGGADAARAERELLQRGAWSKQDTPIKDLEDGAFRLRSVSFGLAVGPQTTEASNDRVKLEGYNVLRGASVRGRQLALEDARIYLTDSSGLEHTLATGEINHAHHLTWDGPAYWLQGTWYVDASQTVGLVTVNPSILTVLVQRIQRGQAP